MGKKGRRVWKEGGDEDEIGEGVMEEYKKKKMSYQKIEKIQMLEEKKKKKKMKEKIDIYEEGEEE